MPGRITGLSRATRCALMLRAADDAGRVRCVYCQRLLLLKRAPGTGAGMRAATVDHVLPRCLGGRTEPRNMVAACASCNRRKWDDTLESFLTQPGCREGVESRVAAQLRAPLDLEKGRAMARELYPRPVTAARLAARLAEFDVYAADAACEVFQ